MWNWKRTTWYENHAVSFRVHSESRVKPGIRSWSEALGHFWQYGLQGGANVGTPRLQEEDKGQEEVFSLSICLSIYLSNLQQTVCPFENKMRGRYFYKEVCFVHSLNLVNHVWYYTTQVYHFYIIHIYFIFILFIKIEKNSSFFY